MENTTSEYMSNIRSGAACWFTGANVSTRREIMRENGKVHPLEIGLSVGLADTSSSRFCVCVAMPHFVYKALSVSFATRTRAGTRGGRSTRTLTHKQHGKHVTLTAIGQLQSLSFSIKYEERRDRPTGTSQSSSFQQFSQFTAPSLSLSLSPSLCLSLSVYLSLSLSKTTHFRLSVNVCGAQHFCWFLSSCCRCGFPYCHNYITVFSPTLVSEVYFVCKQMNVNIGLNLDFTIRQHH